MPAWLGSDIVSRLWDMAGPTLAFVIHQSLRRAPNSILTLQRVSEVLLMRAVSSECHLPLTPRDRMGQLLGGEAPGEHP